MLLKPNGLSAFVFLLLMTCCAQRSGEGLGEAFAQGPLNLPGGVSDSAGRMGFVSNPEGGIDALDLQTGQLLWSASEALRPLLVFGERLVTQAAEPGRTNILRIVVLDISQKGKRVLESEPVVFPEWVTVSSGRSFASEAGLDNGHLLINWKASSRYEGGAPPPREILEKYRKDASGTVRIDLQTGKVEMLSGDRMEAPPPFKQHKALEDLTSYPYRRGPSSSTKPLVVGNRVIALELEESQEQQTLLLKRWDLETGRPDDAVLLLRGRRLEPTVTADGHYLLVHQSAIEPSSPPAQDTWWVYALDSGQRVSEKLIRERGAEDMAVFGPRVFYTVEETQSTPTVSGSILPRTLKAVELDSGKLLWEHKILGRRVSPPPPRRP